jgi:endonuclease/exonuclease/phosphatase family metal-dependent hydrolase
MVLYLRVMNFNIFYGGTTLDLQTGLKGKTLYSHPETIEQVVRAIVAANVDIVGVEEADGNTELLAKKLGWFYSFRFNVISRFPIWETDMANCAFVEVEIGKFVLMAVVHAPSTPYGPYLVRDGALKDQVVAIEQSFRVTAIAPHIRKIVADQRKYRAPLFLAGDFNSPSERDWSLQVCRKRELNYAVDWPMSAFVESVGLHDSYRVAHPCPSDKPGFTWLKDGPECVENEVEDRIDWLMYSGDVQVKGSWTMGGTEASDLIFKHWPSDHCAVVSEFRVQPIPFPREVIFVSRKSCFAGQEIRVRTSANAHLKIKHNNLLVQDFHMESSCAIIHAPSNPGVYEITSSSGHCTFNVRPKEAQIRVLGAVYHGAHSIPVQVKGSAGMLFDWIRIRNISNPAKTYVYTYTGSISEGIVRIEPPFFMEENSPIWPLPIGEYEMLLLQDGGHQLLAQTRFSVTSSPQLV